MKLQVYYCTQEGIVCGKLIVQENVILFCPQCESNDNERFSSEKLQEFECVIEVADMAVVQKKRMHNESGQYVTNLDDKKHYMYDYFLQIHLSNLNGM